MVQLYRCSLLLSEIEFVLCLSFFLLWVISKGSGVRNFFILPSYKWQSWACCSSRLFSRGFGEVICSTLVPPDIPIKPDSGVSAEPGRQTLSVCSLWAQTNQIQLSQMLLQTTCFPFLFLHFSSAPQPLGKEYLSWILWEHSRKGGKHVQRAGGEREPGCLRNCKRTSVTGSQRVRKLRGRGS